MHEESVKKKIAKDEETRKIAKEEATNMGVSLFFLFILLLFIIIGFRIDNDDHFKDIERHLQQIEQKK